MDVINITINILMDEPMAVSQRRNIPSSPPAGEPFTGWNLQKGAHVLGPAQRFRENTGSNQRFMGNYIGDTYLYNLYNLYVYIYVCILCIHVWWFNHEE